MSSGDRFVSIQPKRLMGFLDFRDRFLDYVKAQLQHIVEVAYGDDGTVGGTILMSEFGTGQNRFQLDNDITGSDGLGHFLKTDAELAGRDVGLRFENTLSELYRVALHYTERPRGIQVNPRTGFPEFLEWEETIGERAEPNLVTDNGNGTVTFRVNSVARVFGADATLDQTGRRCLVWKKTPGKTAITEAAAVELCTVSLSSGNNVITTTGNFGQTTVSTNTSDYFVLLLGPTVSNHLLGSESGYHFIGTITGAGSGNTPTFDLTGQNNIGPLISDINVISQLHHGNRKIRTTADNLDVDETQIEVLGRPDMSFPLVFSVDEDGDVYAAGTAGIDGAVTLGDDLDVLGATTLEGLTVNLDALISGALTVTGTTNLNGTANVGDADTDTHNVKGDTLFKTTGGTTKAEIKSSTGEIAGGGAVQAGYGLKSHTNTRLGSLDTHVTEIMSYLTMMDGSGTPSIQASGASSAAPKLHVGGLTAAMGSEAFRVTGKSDLRDLLTLGAILNAGTATQGALPRVDMGGINPAALWNGLMQWAGATQYVRTYMLDGSYAIACNCHPSSTGTGTWSSDNTGLPSLRLQITGSVFTLSYKSATASTWTDSPDQWTSKHIFDMGASFGGQTTIAGQLYPVDTASLQSLGSSTKRWSAWIQDSNIDGILYPTGAGLCDLGDASQYFGTMHAATFSAIGSGGHFKFNTPRTFYKTYSGFDATREGFGFTGATDNWNVSNIQDSSTNGAQIFWTRTGADAFNLLWKLDLPQGATITEIRFNHRTGDAGPATDLTYAGWRQGINGASNVITKERFRVASGVNASSVAAATDRSDTAVLDSAAAAAAVDNSLYTYWASLRANNAQDNHVIYGMRVSYTMPHVAL